MRHYCDECIWHDQCGDGFTCEDFVPADESIDALIEERREQFFNEWFEYLDTEEFEE